MEHVVQFLERADDPLDGVLNHQVDDFIGDATSPVGEEPDHRSTDPYGVAEAITSVVPEYDCTVRVPTKLRIYDGAQIRNFANQANVFARTIIR